MERFQDLSLLIGAPVSKFIDTFCDPRDVTEDFKGSLGKFTPCFADIVVLGIAHLVAVVFQILRLIQLTRDTSGPRYRVCGWNRLIKGTTILCSLVCLLIVLFQLQARLAADPVALLNGKIAPFEWIQYILTAVSWGLFLAVFIVEMFRYTQKHSWMVRFPILFIFAGEIAKLRFVVILAHKKEYFFWLYVVYFILEGWLALLAFFWYPSYDGMKVIDSTIDFDYQELNSREVRERTCPEATASWYQTITFSWISPLMVQGYKKPLQFEDIWQLPPSDKVGSVSTSFEKYWEEELKRSKGPSLTRTCWKTVRGQLGWAIPYKLVNDASQFVAPIFINLLLNVVEEGKPSSVGYSLAALMFVGLMLGTIADNQHFQRTMRAGFRLRAVLVHQVFKKVLFLTPDAQQQFSSGRIFNLVTSDAETLQQLCQNLLGVISSPVRIIGAMVMLYVQLGLASLVAIVTLIVVMPAMAYLVRVSARLLKKALRSTDERSKLEGELMNGMDVVKCSAWEDSFWDRIQGVRNTELRVLWNSAVVAAVYAFILNAVPVIVSVLTFTAYVGFGHKLTAAKAFTALSLFTVLRMPLFQLPQLVSQLVNARVALVRLQELLATEQQPQIASHTPAQKGETAIKLIGDFNWDSESDPSLKEVELEVPQGNLIAVVGSTGSGKSSLLSAMLGLMEQTSGPPVELCGHVAYVPQAAFIFGASIRDNILFGLPYDENKYQRAIQASSLGPDLENMPAGDRTELGDRGLNVSGGQKQRISIARAVYSDSEIVLLDDPLSALDAKVAREVHNNCIRGAIKNRTRVLVTNQLQFVAGSDLVLYMSDGEIAEAGTYEELIKAGQGFAQLMKQAEVEQEAEEEALEDDKIDDDKKDNDKKKADTDRGNEATPGTDSGSLTTREGRATGRVSLQILRVYVKAMGGYWAFLLLMSWFILIEAARVGTTVWLSQWTSSVDAPGGAAHKAMWYLGIYAAISGAQILFTMLSAFLSKYLCLHAARVLHNKMLKKLLRAPMSFFHTTPMGRIINRLTKDTSDVDKNLADFAAFFLRSTMQLISTIILIGVIVPFALCALVPIILCFYLLYCYFQASVREVKRLDAISRSPVYSSIGEELAGLATIRAYRAENRLIDRNADLLDASVIYSLVNQSMNRWLSVRLESLGALSALAAALLTVEQRGQASIFGLVLSYALQITMLTSIVVRLASLVENNFNAVERLHEYACLKEEAPTNIPGTKPDNWPSNGKVEFQNVKMRYRPGLPLILRGLDVTVSPKTRVGVVGRTGAGKTSLINSLFRLMELDNGKIVIDGLDVSKLGLHQLRGSMSLIPQTPVLFTGSLRSNLTPFGEHTDEQLWTALKRAHLAQMVENSPDGLDMILSEGGAPLSAGQKQLVAMARALLRKSKVICLDEATASIDTDTDALIQHTINEEFADCTIIIIAHRLHTIIDADKVLVMDRGEAAEYGSPAELLANKDGLFSSMVAETGEGTSKFLHDVVSGNINARDNQRVQAMRAKETVSTRPDNIEGTRDVAKELLERAQGCRKILDNSLAVLREKEGAERFQRELQLYRENGGNAGDLAYVNASMKDALEALETISRIAASMNESLGNPIGNPVGENESESKNPGYGSVALAGSSIGRALSRGRPSLDRSESSVSPNSSPFQPLNGRRSAGTSSSASGISTYKSMPLTLPTRLSLEAPRQSLISSKRASRKSISARPLKSALSSKRIRTDYVRLKDEDPTISNAPDLH